ncbi:hypothetical protein PLEOSDRAFT_169393 [Pleurotus ostreatus PC15]|uniref:Uncharacterized protein n=1 Tax=Pleurotus ostreatus (strain PC15) TaxID=1137138 RepID=A0A067NBF8_PLEO1|nr:hypothetical protein PLEOSDRAFT_169393 [Pleurotus ostreatus PC15]
MSQFIAASLILALSATAATFTVLDVDPGVAQSSDYIIVLHRLLGSSTLENDSDLDLRPIVPTFDINSPYSFSQTANMATVLPQAPLDDGLALDAGVVGEVPAEDPMAPGVFGGAAANSPTQTPSVCVPQLHITCCENGEPSCGAAVAEFPKASATTVPVTTLLYSKCFGDLIRSGAITADANRPDRDDGWTRSSIVQEYLFCWEQAYMLRANLSHVSLAYSHAASAIFSYEPRQLCTSGEFPVAQTLHARSGLQALDTVHKSERQVVA